MGPLSRRLRHKLLEYINDVCADEVKEHLTQGNTETEVDLPTEFNYTLKNVDYMIRCESATAHINIIKNEYPCEVSERSLPEYDILEIELVGAIIVSDGETYKNTMFSSHDSEHFELITLNTSRRQASYLNKVEELGSLIGRPDLDASELYEIENIIEDIKDKHETLKKNNLYRSICI